MPTAPAAFTRLLVPQFLSALTTTAITSLFLINLCSAIFQCGCTALWAGGGMHCNIHMANMRHCPFCINGRSGYRVALWSTLAVQLAIALWPTAWSMRTRFAAALIAFPVVGTLVALCYGAANAYWR